MGKSEPITGGCLCGAVRYEVNEPPYDAHYCHCRTCQKASGAPVVAGAFLSRDALRFTCGEPKLYKSSAIVERGFCASCGTYLLYQPIIPEWSDWIIITIASLDCPENMPPQRHYGTESQMVWLNIHDALPREQYEDDFVEILTNAYHDKRAAVLRRYGSR